MILFADYNTPYLFAISFVLLIGLLEIFALICGHMLSGALDAHLDHYDSITTGHISQALHYLNIGRLPALVVLCLLAGFFGLIGILLQHACIMVWQSPLSNLFVVPVSLLFTIIAVHYTGKIVAPWIPRDHSSAIRGARRIRKKSYAKVFRASVRAETSRLPVCGSAARRNRRLG